MALLLITHDLGIVSTMAHRVALMYAGQVVEVAETSEFFARPLHPYAAMLFAALPETAKRGQQLAAIGGTVPALNQAFAGCRFVARCPSAFAACHNTQPELYQPVVAHTVRCLLHRKGSQRSSSRAPLAAASMLKRRAGGDRRFD